MPWWTDSSGTHGGQRNHLRLQSYSRCLPSHVTWAMRCDRLLTILTPLDRRRVPSRLRIRNIAHHSDLATIRGPNVSVVASWDTHKFAAPKRIHLFHSDRTGGLTGQTDHSDVMEDPHRETKYRPGPNPHWPVVLAGGRTYRTVPDSGWRGVSGNRLLTGGTTARHTNHI